MIFYPEHLEPGWSEKKKAVDAAIAPKVQRLRKKSRESVAHKKLARDRVQSVEYAKRLPPVSVRRLVDHIDHVVKLVGIDHVGIGSDFDGVQSTFSDLVDVSQLPNLTHELLRRGYSAATLKKFSAATCCVSWKRWKRIDSCTGGCQPHSGGKALPYRVSRFLFEASPPKFTLRRSLTILYAQFGKAKAFPHGQAAEPLLRR